jgi:putative endonuclease
MILSRTQTGELGERAAETFLIRNGLTLLENNFRSRFGEVDLIMRDGDYIVFVEVRLRASKAYGGGAASVDRRKQRRIVRTAEYFLSRRPELATSPCRFDVVALGAEPTGLEWITNAFEVESWT